MLPQRCSKPALKLCEPVTYETEDLKYRLFSGCQPVIQNAPPSLPVDTSRVDGRPSFQENCSRRHLLYCTEKPASSSNRFDIEAVYRACAW